MLIMSDNPTAQPSASTGRRRELQSQPLRAEVPALGTVLFSVDKGLLNHPEAQRAIG